MRIEKFIKTQCGLERYKYLKKNYSPQNIVNASSEEKALLIHQTKNKNEISFNN